MVRHILVLIICLLLVAPQVTADSEAIRRRRRGVLEVDHPDSAAEILASLWETDGIQPNQRSLAKKGDKKGAKKDSKKGSKKGQMKGDDMSFYYF
jgi:hypothetical protein